MKRSKLLIFPLLAAIPALPLLSAETPNACFGKVDLTQGEASKHFRDWPAGKSPAVIGKKVSENFLPRANYQGHKDLRYPDTITWFGAL